MQNLLVKLGCSPGIPLPDLMCSCLWALAPTTLNFFQFSLNKIPAILWDPIKHCLSKASSDHCSLKSSPLNTLVFLFELSCYHITCQLFPRLLDGKLLNLRIINLRVSHSHTAGSQEVVFNNHMPSV